MSDAISAKQYQWILLERTNRVGLVRLNRPEARNALSPELLLELADALHALDGDPGIGCLVLTGEGKAFAAGADIKAMAEMSATDMLQSDWMDRWASIRHLKKPLIAAVNGYALGGGFELALACDLIIAGNDSKFGLPEVGIGVIPGSGGTQRLTKLIGKTRAMEMVLTGQFCTAEQGLQLGFVNRVVDPAKTLETTLELAYSIADKPMLAVQLAKAAILDALETPLEQGLASERHRFSLLFGSPDQREGMRAFQEKRTPIWQHQSLKQ